MDRVFIGLALYQGAEHIQAQLESIAAQTHSSWRLVVSDDGSQDNGPDIVHDFAAAWPKGQVELVDGPRQGAARNFLSLLNYAAPGEFLAFADQDDVWHPEKLSLALWALASSAPSVGLYCARTTICDANLKPLTGSRRFNGPFDFRNALVQALTAGNTIVLPPEAAMLARRAAHGAISAGIEAHDWWLYQLITGAGFEIFRDDAEVLLYRQHGDNLKGRNDTLPAMRARLSQLYSGSFGLWLSLNMRALLAVEEELTDENRKLLHRFDAALAAPGWQMAQIFRRLGIRRQTVAGTAALYTAALAGKLNKG